MTPREQLELLEAPRRTLAPGEYRAYLAPRALEEMTGLLAVGRFLGAGPGDQAEPASAHGARAQTLTSEARPWWRTPPKASRRRSRPTASSSRRA